MSWSGLQHYCLALPFIRFCPWQWRRPSLGASVKRHRTKWAEGVKVEIYLKGIGWRAEKESLGSLGSLLEPICHFPQPTGRRRRHSNNYILMAAAPQVMKVCCSIAKLRLIPVSKLSPLPLPQMAAVQKIEFAKDFD